MCGASPMMLKEAVSSSRNKSGDERRFVRHQSSISRIWVSASGVVPTGRLTAADATRPEWRMLAAADPPQPTSRMPIALHAGRGARRQ